MEGSNRAMELVVGQIDRRIHFLQENLSQIRRETAQLREELHAEIARLRAEIRSGARQLLG